MSKKIDLSDIGISLEKVVRRIKEDLSLLPKSELIELKKRSGLQDAQISNYFGDGTYNKPPSLEAVVRMANILKKPIDYYLYGRYPDIDEDSDCYRIPTIMPMLNKNMDIMLAGDNCFYMNRRFTESKKLYCMKIEGDMMNPTIKENDIVIIDYSKKRIINEGKIHVFFNPDLPFIQTKRLYISRDKIVVKTDNPNYSPYLISFDKIRLIGQIIKIFKNS